MSSHTDRAFQKAAAKGAAAACSQERWGYLMSLSKRELAEMVCHLGAAATDSYDSTIANDALMLPRLRDEHEILKSNGLI